MALAGFPEPSQAKDPGGLASNGFDNNGTNVPKKAYKPGKNVRDDNEYKKENPDAEKRKYYEQGGKSTNNDSKCRAKLAYKAARYNGPAGGYDGTTPIPGGGDYGPMPKNPEEIIHNIYKFVEDMLYPRQGNDAGFFTDKEICDDIKNGKIDIGKPRPGQEGYACIVSAHFFTSLVRELGFPAVEKNVIPSLGKNKWGGQTAAADVYYDGEWHFYDPWESFKDIKDYLQGDGHAYITPGLYHDAHIWERESPPSVPVIGGGSINDYYFANGRPDEEGWGDKPKFIVTKNGAQIIIKTTSLWLGLEDSDGHYAGYPREIDDVALVDSIYVPHDRLIPRTRLDNAGPETYDYELITLLYDDDEIAGIHDYAAILTNPGPQPQDYELEVEALPVTFAISAEPTNLLKGTLPPGASIRFPVRVKIGEPLDLPPDPVTKAVSTPLYDQTTTVSWTPVAHAVSYRISRGNVMVAVLPTSGVELIANVEEPGYQLEANAGDIIYVQAVNARGELSSLDPELGSSTVAVEPPSNLYLWMIAFAILLMVLLVMANRFGQQKIAASLQE